MKSVLLLLAIFLLSFSKLSAQKKFGIEAGVLRSKVEMKGDNKLNSEPKTGFRLGVFAEFPITQNICFNPALSYVNKGSKFDNTWMFMGTARNSKVHETTNFIELPLNVLYKINLSKIKWLAGAGVVAGYGINGKDKFDLTVFNNDGTSTRSSGETEIKFDGKKDAYDSKMHLKPLEIGMNVFVGADVFDRVRVQFQFRPNFSDLAVDNSSYKNTYYYCFAVGFFF